MDMKTASVKRNRSALKKTSQRATQQNPAWIPSYRSRCLILFDFVGIVEHTVVVRFHASDSFSLHASESLSLKSINISHHENRSLLCVTNLIVCIKKFIRSLNCTRLQNKIQFNLILYINKFIQPTITLIEECLKNIGRILSKSIQYTDASGNFLRNFVYYEDERYFKMTVASCRKEIATIVKLSFQIQHVMDSLERSVMSPCEDQLKDQVSFIEKFRCSFIAGIQSLRFVCINLELSLYNTEYSPIPSNVSQVRQNTCATRYHTYLYNKFMRDLKHLQMPKELVEHLSELKSLLKKDMKKIKENDLMFVKHYMNYVQKRPSTSMTAFSEEQVKLMTGMILESRTDSDQTDSSAELSTIITTDTADSTLVIPNSEALAAAEGKEETEQVPDTRK